MAKKKRFEIPALPPKRAELSDNPVKLCNEISRIFRTKMREKCDIDGVMSQPGARLVMSLLAISDGLKQIELVEKTRLRAPTISVIVKRMTDEGLVELRSDERDKRVKKVYLTEKGRKFDSDEIRRIRSMDAVGLAGFEEDECETLMELLSRIRDNLLDMQTEAEEKK